jgi:general secretion pathway protein D
MKMTNGRRQGHVVWIVLCLLLSGCAADRLYRQALADFDSGQVEAGLQKLEEAVRLNPSDHALQVELKRRKESIIYRLLRVADAARSALRFREAEAGYQRVLALDEYNANARAGLELIEQGRRHEGMVAAAKDLFRQSDLSGAKAQLTQVLVADPNHPGAVELLREIEERTQRNTTAKAAIKAKQEAAVNLEFRDAKLAIVFEALSRTSGINFVLDKDVKGDVKASLFLKDLPVDEALDLIVSQQALRKKVLTDNTVLVYPNTPDKRKQYEDQVIRSFYLTHADPKQAMNLLKVMLDTKVLFVDDRSRLVIIRDTPEAVQMAERLMGSLDLAEPEVMLDVEVIEIQRSRLQELGIRYPTQWTVAATAGGAASLTLDALLKLTTSQVTSSPLSLTADLKKEVSSSDILASPHIRARNREKAKILIGDRVPVITNAVTPTAAGSSVVTGSVQYVDVGLKLEVEPLIHRDSDVAIKMNLEVSNIVREVNNTVSGTQAYQIGTRTASTLLQLKDGETQVLAGLISDEERQISNRIPGLGDLPVLGRLFASQRDDGRKSEIVMSITPHVIRPTARPDPNVVEFLFGTEAMRSGPFGAKPADEPRAIPAQGRGASGGLVPAPPAGALTPSAPPPTPRDLFTPPPALDLGAPAPPAVSPPQETGESPNSESNASGADN